ncbi:E3 ubiquitin-protein ligase RNF180 isoform X1 [Folsomia candida]|nr:E3 ubiquitin-protein ligase RNF180 isoform X1 [Folsomia candida]
MDPNQLESTVVPMKCKKCRFLLLEHPKVPVEDSHGEPFVDLMTLENKGPSSCHSQVWYIPEESMPEWMTASMDKGDWTKGKIMCPKCEARIGSYSFVSGFKCPCGSRVVPPIHIVKSKVDFIQPFYVAISSSVETSILPSSTLL